MTEELSPSTSQPASSAVPLPLYQPVVTWVLLIGIGIAFALELLLGGSTSTQALVVMGAQVNGLVDAGQYWRLLTAMFLHIGIPHLAFNAYALYALGLDLERYYGPLRFTLIYLLSGLAGGVLYFVLGPPMVVSAGASGAIFGIIGAELAFILSNRRLFGSFGKQRLTNVGVLLLINLFLGFSIPGINNIAHIGGFLGGFALGFALTPRYGVTWNTSSYVPGPQLENRSSPGIAVAGVITAIILLVLGLQVG